MCNRYTINATSAELAEWLEAVLPEEFEPAGEIFPYADAPVLLLGEGQRREIRPMQFSITPAWSKDQKVKYQTNNARVEDIEAKKTFSGPLRKHRCVVPISTFREPCYWGEPAGKEVEFAPVAEPLLFAAAIYSLWNHKLTMALLLRPAGEYVMRHGHHRQPLFLRREGLEAWIGGGERDAALSKGVLRQYAHEPELSYRVARSMAPAWKSRQSARVAERDKQMAAIEAAGPLGY